MLAANEGSILLYVVTERHHERLDRDTETAGSPRRELHYRRDPWLDPTSIGPKSGVAREQFNTSVAPAAQHAARIHGLQIPTPSQYIQVASILKYDDNSFDPALFSCPLCWFFQKTGIMSIVETLLGPGPGLSDAPVSVF